MLGPPRSGNELSYKHWCPKGRTVAIRQAGLETRPRGWAGDEEAGVQRGLGTRSSTGFMELDEIQTSNRVAMIEDRAVGEDAVWL